MVFVIDVKHSAKQGEFLISGNFSNRHWEVIRTLDQFKILAEKLDAKNHEIHFPSEPEVKNLESFLSNVISTYQADLWLSDDLMDFLDGESCKSQISKARISFLTSEVCHLREQLSSVQSSQVEMRTELSGLKETIKTLSSQFTSKSTVSEEYHPIINASEFLARDVVICRPSPRLSLISVATADSSASGMAPVESMDESQEMTDQVLNPSEDDILKNSTPAEEPPLEPMSTLVYPLPVNTHLPPEAFPSNEVSQSFTEGIEHILKSIGPLEKQIAQRDSAVAWLKKQVRIALGASVFEVGFQATRCILPEDPIRVNVVISKGLLPSWHLMVCERLHSQVEKANSYGGTYYIPFDEDDALDPFFNDPTPVINHALGAVYHSKNNLNHSVHFTIDTITIEIVANSRVDFCWLALVEELDEKVQNNRVFKEAFCLVRAWWAYETISYVGVSIKHYLTDQQLLVMLASVFNRYWEHITTPLQALCLFFSEFTNYDGTNQIITLQGIVSFQTRASNQPNVIEVKPYHFLNSAFVEKYWQVFNINVSVEHEVTNNTKRLSSSSDEGLTVDSQLVNSESSKASPSHAISQPPQPRHSDPAVLNTMLKQLSQSNLHHFERSSFNILHPFLHTNMVNEKLSVRRVNRILKVFQGAANNLVFTMKRVREGTASSREAMTEFFSNAMQLFQMRSAGYEGTAISELFAYKGGCEQALELLDYHDLIMEAKVSDRALEILAMEILATKGSLPVGEIGKVLADVTSIPNLSQKLKEKFGGLKKFLEQFASSFVISNDHPFNPNVLLRSSLSAEHLEMIDKGMFPPQLLIRAKKTNSASKKKKAHSISSLQSMAPNESNYRVDFSSPLPSALTNMHGGSTGSMNQAPNTTPSPITALPSAYRAAASANTATKTVMLNNQQNITPISALKSSRAKSIPSNKVTHFQQPPPYYPHHNVQSPEPYPYNPPNPHYRPSSQPNYQGYPGYSMQEKYYNETEGMGMRRPSGGNLPSYAGGVEAVQHNNYGNSYMPHNTGTTPDSGISQYASSMSYHTDNSSRSNSNSYSGGNNQGYVNSLLQAIPPTEPSYSNPLLSQLRMDSIEVNSNMMDNDGSNLMYSVGNNANSTHFPPEFSPDPQQERRNLSMIDSLFPVTDDENSVKGEAGVSSKAQSNANRNSYVSRLFLS